MSIYFPIANQRVASDALHEGQRGGAQVQVQPENGGDTQVLRFSRHRDRTLYSADSLLCGLMTLRWMLLDASAPDHAKAEMSRMISNPTHPDAAIYPRSWVWDIPSQFFLQQIVKSVARCAPMRSAYHSVLITCSRGNLRPSIDWVSKGVRRMS